MSQDFRVRREGGYTSSLPISTVFSLYLSPLLIPFPEDSEPSLAPPASIALCLSASAAPIRPEETVRPELGHLGRDPGWGRGTRELDQKGKWGVLVEPLCVYLIYCVLCL